MSKREKRLSSGFTLVEVLLAMAISMMILAGVGYLYYSIAIAWSSHKEGDLELQHHHSIFAFLEDEISIKPSLPVRETKGIDSSLQWLRLPDSNHYDPIYLSWVAKNPPAFLTSGQWIDGFSVRLFLNFDSREGLSLIWHPEDPKINRMDLEDYEVDDYIFEFVLSTDVSRFQYAYYDSEKDEWELFDHDSGLDPDEMGLPAAVVFDVEHKGEVVTRTIYLGQNEEGKREE